MTFFSLVDETRVRLRSSTGNDYINASLIKVTSSYSVVFTFIFLFHSVQSGRTLPWSYVHRAALYFVLSKQILIVLVAYTLAD
jgi:protein tyrosine phosphatase